VKKHEMKNMIRNRVRVSVADSMLLIGIGFAASYWVLESLLNIFTSSNVNFMSQLFGPDINEVWPRLIVFCLFIFFGSHVQFTIKNRKKAEEALKESEEKYRTILESIEEGYYEVDIDGNFTFFNDSTCSIFGYGKDELLGMNFREYTSPEVSKKMSQIFRQVYKTDKPSNFSHCEVMVKDGLRRILDVSVSLMKDKENQPIGLRGIVRDVTRRLKAERERMKLEAQLREARSATILGLAKLAEYRDEGTGTHLERIREYARIIAEEVAKNPKYAGYITTEYTEDIFRSSILHDIGKVGIPDAILLKPDGLNADEFAIIKRHTLLGGDALNAIDSKIEGQSFLTLGKEIAYYHHEKWDGTGYPKGLKKLEIPLSARFVALADVYDALTSKRLYKDALPHEKSRDIIIGLKGIHFDPDVVDAFLKKEDEFKRICRELHQEETDVSDQVEPEPIAVYQDFRS
jgi:PAS domain S-box-containing protein